MRLFIYVAVLIMGSGALISPSPISGAGQAPEVGSIVVIVRAKDEVETPLDRGSVTVNRGGVSKTARWDPTDYYVVRGLLPGKYNVTAHAPGYQSRSTKAIIKKYETTRVEIDLPAAPLPRPRSR